MNIDPVVFRYVVVFLLLVLIYLAVALDSVTVVFSIKVSLFTFAL